MFDRMDEEDCGDNKIDNDGDNQQPLLKESNDNSKNELEAFSSMLNLDASSSNSLVVNEYDSGVEDDVKPSKKEVRTKIFLVFYLLICSPIIRMFDYFCRRYCLW